MGTRLTAQEMAQTVLAAQKRKPGVFDMNEWFGVTSDNEPLTFGDRVILEPGDDPVTCGTTMCLAGWGAHLGGYTLVLRQLGTDYAYKAAQDVTGNTAPIEGIGMDAWGLHSRNAFDLFWTSDDKAQRWLELVADGMDVNEAVAVIRRMG